MFSCTSSTNFNSTHCKGEEGAVEKLEQDFNDLFKHQVTPEEVDLPVIKEEGCYYWGIDGKKYLDFTSGIAVTNVGHRHPKVVQAIKDAADQLVHGPIGVIQYESILRLADELAEILPGDLDCFFFSNSGTEAIEGALKLAKFVTKRPYVISFTGCFHGRSQGALSVSTSKSKYRKFQQPNGLTYQVPYFNPSLFNDLWIVFRFLKISLTLYNANIMPTQIKKFK